MTRPCANQSQPPRTTFLHPKAPKSEKTRKPSTNQQSDDRFATCLFQYHSQTMCSGIDCHLLLRCSIPKEKPLNFTISQTNNKPESATWANASSRHRLELHSLGQLPNTKPHTTQQSHLPTRVLIQRLKGRKIQRKESNERNMTRNPSKPWFRRRIRKQHPISLIEIAFSFSEQTSSTHAKNEISPADSNKGQLEYIWKKRRLLPRSKKVST